MWKFLKSASDKSHWLKHENKEICFIGKSNVGKSSLINALANNKKLAKTSKTPGRTQLINYFQNNKGLVIVDLPGYGFANVSIKTQEKMFAMVDQYFNENKPNVVFLLIDSRRGVSLQDNQIIEHLLELNHNVTLILTKLDKATQKEISSTMKNHYFHKLKYFQVSVSNQKKIDQLKQFIEKI